MLNKKNITKKAKRKKKNKFTLSLSILWLKVFSILYIYFSGKNNFLRGNRKKKKKKEKYVHESAILKCSHISTNYWHVKSASTCFISCLVGYPDAPFSCQSFISYFSFLSGTYVYTRSQVGWCHVKWISTDQWKLAAFHIFFFLFFLYQVFYQNNLVLGKDP